jgi:DNA-binding XRE family transcriptional regulator
MTLGKRVMDAREKLGMTQSQLADKIGISQQTLCTIEKDQRSQPRTIKAIARTLQLTPEFLLFGSEGDRIIPLEKVSLISLQDIPGFLNKTSAKIFLQVYVPYQGDMKGMFAFEIMDDSMEGEKESFAKNDIVLLDPHKTPKSGDFVLIFKNNEIPFFRQLISDPGGDFLVSLNKMYPPVKIDDSIKIKAVAILKYSATQFF